MLLVMDNLLKKAVLTDSIPSVRYIAKESKRLNFSNVERSIMLSKCACDNAI
jgi:hypothetical protein